MQQASHRNLILSPSCRILVAYLQKEQFSLYSNHFDSYFTSFTHLSPQHPVEVTMAFSWQEEMVSCVENLLAHVTPGLCRAHHLRPCGNPSLLSTPRGCGSSITQGWGASLASGDPLALTSVLPVTHSGSGTSLLCTYVWKMKGPTLVLLTPSKSSADGVPFTCTQCPSVKW